MSLIKKRQGMTIPEVIVSLAIISLTLLSLWEAFNLSRMSQRQSARYEQVAAVAEDLLAEVAMGNVTAQGLTTLEPPNDALRYQLLVAASDTAGVVQVTLYLYGLPGETWCFYTMVPVSADEP